MLGLRSPRSLRVCRALTIDDHSNERPVLLTTGFFRNVKSPAAVVQHADPETLMPEPRFLTDVALAIPLVHELWLNWRAILAEIDAFTTRFNDPFVEYPRYRIRDGGPFLYENEWKVLPTTIIDGEALDATIDSPIGATDTDLKRRHAELLARVRGGMPTLDRILSPAERAGFCANGFISRIKPGTVLQPHTGWVGDWLRVHIGLRTDPGATITVGDETRTWTDGGILAFRDGGPWLHSVVHRGTRERLIISTDLRIAMLAPAFERMGIDMRSLAPFVSGRTTAAFEAAAWQAGPPPGHQ